MTSARVAIVAHPQWLERWQAACVHRLQQAGVEIALVVRPPAGSASRHASSALWEAYLRYGGYPRSRRSAGLGTSLLDVSVLDWDASAARLDQYGLDVVLWLDLDQPPPPDLVQQVPLGVWAFGTADDREQLRFPPCFWSIEQGQPLTTFCLYQMSPDGTIGILRRAHLQTLGYSYGRNVDAALAIAVQWPAALLAGCRREETRALTLSLYHGRSSGPGTISTLIFLGRSLLDFVHVSALFLGTREQWNIGIVRRPIHSFLAGAPEPGDIHWLPRHKLEGFLADPFALEEGGDLTILAEQFVAREGKGRIVVLERGPDQDFSVRGVTLERGEHMAYPYVFRYDDAVYCVPDTGSAREAVLYRATAFPYRWERVATLLRDIAAYDATIFRHEDRWWLLCSVGGGPDSHLRTRESGAFSTLYAWYADDLVGPWTPHVCNPIKADVRSSRPAGTPFLHQGALYRPAQDCLAGYGRAVQLNRVMALTPTGFAEEPVVRLAPIPGGAYPDGWHTLSAAGPYTLLDGKRTQLSVAGTMRRFKRLAKTFSILSR